MVPDKDISPMELSLSSNWILLLTTSLNPLITISLAGLIVPQQLVLTPRRMVLLPLILQTCSVPKTPMKLLETISPLEYSITAPSGGTLSSALIMLMALSSPHLRSSVEL